jgi:hypothetical protein
MLAGIAASYRICLGVKGSLVRIQSTRPEFYAGQRLIVLTCFLLPTMVPTKIAKGCFYRKKKHVFLSVAIVGYYPTIEA